MLNSQFVPNLIYDTIMVSALSATSKKETIKKARNRIKEENQAGEDRLKGRRTDRQTDRQLPEDTLPESL